MEESRECGSSSLPVRGTIVLVVPEDVQLDNLAGLLYLAADQGICEYISVHFNGSMLCVPFVGSQLARTISCWKGDRINHSLIFGFSCRWEQCVYARL